MAESGEDIYTRCLDILQPSGSDAEGAIEGQRALVASSNLSTAYSRCRCGQRPMVHCERRFQHSSMSFTSKPDACRRK